MMLTLSVVKFIEVPHNYLKKNISRISCCFFGLLKTLTHLVYINNKKQASTDFLPQQF